MTQHEITKAAPLLDASGNLAEPGWARSLLPVYCRSQIRAPKTRIKEWDYYCITDGHIGLARRLDQRLAGIGHARHAGVRGKGEGLPCQQTVDQAGGATCDHVLVATNERLGDA